MRPRTTRWLAALLALALAVPAAAQDADPARLDGVWQGTVAGQRVRASFDWRDWRSQPDLLAIYYYDHVKRLIRLEQQGEGFRERFAYTSERGASWTFTQVSENELVGDWGGGQGAQPIRLARLPFEQTGMRPNPCESEAFMEPLFAGGQVDEVPAMSGDQPYTRLVFQPPTHLQPQDDDDFGPVAIETFAIEEVSSADRAINAVLATHLPRGGTADEYARCLIGNAAWNGVLGNFSLKARPEFVTQQWLGLVETHALYCGGAHPSYWESRRTFDRRSGREVDPLGWFLEAGFARQPEGRGDTAYLQSEMTEPLKAVVLEHWPRGDDYEPDCIYAAESAFGWSIGVVEDGIAFIPGVPHVAAMCAYTVVVPWTDIEPFLSPEGRVLMLTLAP